MAWSRNASARACPVPKSGRSCSEVDATGRHWADLCPVRQAAHRLLPVVIRPRSLASSASAGRKSQRGGRGLAVKQRARGEARLPELSIGGGIQAPACLGQTPGVHVHAAAARVGRQSVCSTLVAVVQPTDFGQLHDAAHLRPVRGASLGCVLAQRQR